MMNMNWILQQTPFISRDEDQNYKMQRNSTKWLYGTKLAEESFYERKKLLANLNAGDIIKISGEDEFRDQ